MSQSVRPRPGFDPGAGARVSRTAKPGRTSTGGVPLYDAALDPNCPINRTPAYVKRVQRAERAERAEQLSARRKWLSRGQPSAAKGSAAAAFLSDGGREALASTGRGRPRGADTPGGHGGHGSEGRTGTRSHPSEMQALLDAPISESGLAGGSVSMLSAGGSMRGTGGTYGAGARKAARTAAVLSVTSESVALGVRTGTGA